MLPKKRQLALGLSDHSIKILDLANNFQPLTNLNGHTNSVFALNYSPDEKVLVSAGRDAHMKFWDSENYTLLENIVAHMYAINFLSFKDDGKYLVTCSMDKSIKVWDAKKTIS